MKTSICTEGTKTCGNCMHFDGVATPTGKWKQKIAGQCKAKIVLGALPMSCRVDVRMMYVWPKDDAAKCPCHEWRAV